MNPNSPIENPQNPNEYITVWTNRPFGKKEKISMSLESDGTLRVKLYTENVFRRFTNFLEKKFGKSQNESHERKHYSIQEKSVTNIDRAFYQEEIKKIQNLLDKKKSLQAFLSQLEADSTQFQAQHKPVDPISKRSQDSSTTPETDPDRQTSLEAALPHETTPPQEETLTPEEVSKRENTIKALRSELNTLVAEIDKQNSSPELQTYKRLKETVEQIKTTAQTALSQMTALQDKNTSSKQFQESVNEIKSNNTQWSRHFDTVRQVLVQEVALQGTIDAFQQQIHLFPEEQQETWKQFIAGRNSPSGLNESSLDAVKLRRQKIDTFKTTVCEAFQRQLEGRIEAAVKRLEENQTSQSLGHSNEQINAAVNTFKTIAAAQRVRAWKSLQQSTPETDPTRLIERQGNIENEEAVDKSFTDLISTPIPEKGYFEKFYSALPNPFKSLLPSFFSSKKPINESIERQFAEKRSFDEITLFYAHHTFALIQEKLATVFQDQTRSADAPKELLNRVNALKEQRVTTSDLDALISDFTVYAKTKNKGDERNLLLDTAEKLAGLNRALSVVITSQNANNASIKSAICATYRDIFQESTYPSILQTAQATAEKIFPYYPEEIDLKDLSGLWEKAITSAYEPVIILQNLNILATIHREYTEIAKKAEEKIKTLTGKEKQLAEQTLAALHQTLQSLDVKNHTDKLEEIALAFKRKLLNADHDLKDLYDIEEKKQTLRAAILKEIENFEAEIKKLPSEVLKIEGMLNIDLKALKTKLTTFEETLTSWKEKGMVPNDGPQSALMSLRSFVGCGTRSKEVNLVDVSLETLPFYLERVKEEIARQKSALSKVNIPETSQAYSSFQNKKKELETHIERLTEGVDTSQSNTIQIFRTLSDNHLSKLQFHNAAVAKKRLEEILTNQQSAFNSDSRLEEITKRLKADTDSLDGVLNQSKKTDELSLLVQIEKLADNPTLQKTAKFTFIAILTNKMNRHRGAIDKQLASLHHHKKTQEEAAYLIEKTKEHLSDKLQSLPQPLQRHAGPLCPTKKTDRAAVPQNTLTMPSDDEMVEISVADLRNYATHLDHTIKTQKGHMAVVEEICRKTEDSSRRFEAKIEEAKTHLLSLDRDDQLIAKSTLEEAIKSIQQTKNSYVPPNDVAANKQVTRHRGWFCRRSTPLSQSKKNLADEASLTAEASLAQLRHYQEFIGSGMTALERAVANSSTLVRSIPEQIALNPNPEIAQELRKRFYEQHLSLIAEAKNKMLAYHKNGEIFAAYADYVPVGSPLYKEMDESINKEFEKLIAYETTYPSKETLKGSWFSKEKVVSVATPIAELTAEQMKSYSIEVQALASEDKLNTQLQVTPFTNALLNYEHAKNQAKPHAAKLRENGYFYDARLFERQFNAIAVQVEQYKGKVTTFPELKTFIRNLKQHTQKIEEVIEASRLDQLHSRPMGYAKQIKMILELNPVTEESTHTIDYDIEKLKSMLRANTEEKRQNHETTLLELRNQVGEIFSTYTLTFTSRKKLLDTIQKEIDNFSSFNFKFPSKTPGYSLCCRRIESMKVLDEMSTEEILFANPESGASTLIEASFKRISTVFPYALIKDAHFSYKDALQKAEEQKRLLERKGQISHAADLNDFLAPIINEVATLGKKTIKTEKDLRTLGECLTGYAETINDKTNRMRDIGDMSATDQAAMIPSTSPYRDKLTKHLRREIQSTINKQTTKNQQLLNDLDLLVKNHPIPKTWQSEIVGKIQTAQKTLEKTRSSLDTKNTDALIKTDTELKTFISNFDSRFDNSYQLNALTSRFHSYHNQLQRIQALKTTWEERDLHFSSSIELDRLVEQTKDKLKTLLKTPSTDILKGIDQLLKTLDRLTKELIKGTEAIADKKPKSDTSTLTSLPSTDPRYLQIRSSLKKKLMGKILQQKEALTKYTAHLGSIGTLITNISDAQITTPSLWKIAIENKIGQRIGHLQELSRGLSVVDPKTGNSHIKPFEQLTVPELLQYEKLVESVTKTSSSTRSKTFATGTIEDRLKLERIEKQLGFFNEVLSYFNPLVEQAKEDKKTLLTSGLEGSKTIVFNALSKLSTLEDIDHVLDSIHLAIAGLLKLYGNKDNDPDTIRDDQSPWLTLFLHETEKNSSEKSEELVNTARDLILNQGFSVSFSTHDRELLSPYSAPSLNQEIDTRLEFIANGKRSLEKWHRLLTKTGMEKSELAERLLTFTTGKIPALQVKLENLRRGLSIRNQDGTETFIPVSEIKTFQHLLDYRTSILSATLDLKSFMLEQQDANLLRPLPDEMSPEEDNVEDFDIPPDDALPRTSAPSLMLEAPRITKSSEMLAALATMTNIAGQDVSLLTPENFQALALTHAGNAAYTYASQEYKTAWDKGNTRTALIEEAKSIRDDLPANLQALYNSLVDTSDNNKENSTPGDKVAHLQTLENAEKIKEDLLILHRSTLPSGDADPLFIQLTQSQQCLVNAQLGAINDPIIAPITTKLDAWRDFQSTCLTIDSLQNLNEKVETVRTFQNTSRKLHENATAISPEWLAITARFTEVSTQLRTANQLVLVSQLQEIFNQTQSTLQTLCNKIAEDEPKDFKRQIDAATLPLKEMFVTAASDPLSADFSQELRSQKVSEEEFKKIKERIIKTNKNESDAINKSCMTLTVNINKFRNINLRLKEALLQQIKNIQEGVWLVSSPQEVRRGYMLFKSPVALEQLTREELIAYKQKSAQAIKKAQEEIALLNQCFDRTETTAATTQAAEATTHLARLKPYPYTYLDRINKASERLTESIRDLANSIETSPQVKQITQAASEVESKRQALLEILASVKSESQNYKNSPTIIKQLVDPELSPDSRQKILDFLQRSLNQNIDNSFIVPINFPAELQTNIRSSIEKRKEQFKKSCEALNQRQLTPTMRNQAVKTLLQEFNSAIQLLETHLNFKAGEQIHQNYLSLIVTLERQSNQCRQNNNFARSCDFEVAKNNGETKFSELLKKLQNNTMTLDAFWKECTQLNLALTSRSAINIDVGDSIADQMGYIQRTYPNNYRQLQAYKALVNYNVRGP